MSIGQDDDAKKAENMCACVGVCVRLRRYLSIGNVERPTKEHDGNDDNHNNTNDTDTNDDNKGAVTDPAAAVDADDDDDDDEKVGRRSCALRVVERPKRSKAIALACGLSRFGVLNSFEIGVLRAVILAKQYLFQDRRLDNTAKTQKLPSSRNQRHSGNTKVQSIGAPGCETIATIAGPSVGSFLSTLARTVTANGGDATTRNGGPETGATGCRDATVPRQYSNGRELLAPETATVISACTTTTKPRRPETRSRVRVAVSGSIVWTLQAVPTDLCGE